MAVNSVGQAFGILRSRIHGSPREAEGFLNRLSPEELTVQNRHESRTRVKARKRKRIMGRRENY